MATSVMLHAASGRLQVLFTGYQEVEPARLDAIQKTLENEIEPLIKKILLDAGNSCCSAYWREHMYGIDGLNIYLDSQEVGKKSRILVDGIPAGLSDKQMENLKNQVYYYIVRCLEHKEVLPEFFIYNKSLPKTKRMKPLTPPTPPFRVEIIS